MGGAPSQPPDVRGRRRWPHQSPEQLRPIASAVIPTTSRPRRLPRWSRVSITDIERHQLRLLREKLGIDPPTKTEAKEERSRRTNTA
jgi:hypothetical protein